MPYPLEARPDRRSCAQIADEYYPKAARAARRDGVTLASERVEVPADPRAQYELSIAEHWGDGVPLLPATDDAIEALLAASPYPPITSCASCRRATESRPSSSSRSTPAMAGSRARGVRDRARRARSALGTRVERVRAHDHHVERVPDADRERTVPRRRSASTTAPAAWAAPPGRGSMTIGRAVALCLRNIGGQRAGETDEVGVRATGALRLLHRRVGGAVAVAFARRAPRLHRRRGRRHRARRQGHVPDGRHPQRRPARSALPDRQEHRVPAREHVPRQRRERRGRRRVQPDVGRAFRSPRFPTSTICRRTCATTRGNRSTCGPRATPTSCARTAASTRTGACTSSSDPTRSCPIVCGGLGSLHAIALPSFGESTCRSRPRCVGQ